MPVSFDSVTFEKTHTIVQYFKTEEEMIEITWNERFCQNHFYVKRSEGNVQTKSNSYCGFQNTLVF